MLTMIRFETLSLNLVKRELTAKSILIIKLQNYFPFNYMPLY